LDIFCCQLNFSKETAIIVLLIQKKKKRVKHFTVWVRWDAPSWRSRHPRSASPYTGSPTRKCPRTWCRHCRDDARACPILFRPRLAQPEFFFYILFVCDFFVFSLFLFFDEHFTIKRSGKIKYGNGWLRLMRRTKINKDFFIGFWKSVCKKLKSVINTQHGFKKKYLFIAIRVSRGGSQLVTHSQWASRTMITSPEECSAPMTRALTRPSRLSVRTNLTRPFHRSMYFSNFPFKCSRKK
jgi:hypothetical protein